MKISEITVADVANFLRIEGEDEITLMPIMDAAKEYIKDYTGIPEEELDDYSKFWVAFMVLCQDMYDNRSLVFDKNNSSINKVVDSILGMHRTNLL